MRVYKVLLHLYPAAFQAEYGEEMTAIFARRRREASNMFAVIALWAETLFDAGINAAQVHWDILRQDLRYAARTLGRAPGFTLTAILVTALGVGANTAAFTMVDHVLLRPLPFADSDRLVNLWEDESMRGYSETQLSPANYRDWKRMSTSFEAMGTYRAHSVNLVGIGDPEHLDGVAVTAGLLPMLGTQPALGRLFTPEDEREGSAATVILSHGLWHGLFGGDPGILGRTVILDDQPYTVIGVMPRDFYFPSRDREFWSALRFAPQDFEDRTDTYINVVAKLKRGVSVEQARAEMRLIAAQLERTYPKELAHIGARVVPLRDDLSKQSRLLLLALFGAAICVLLIACTNLANLLLARAVARRKELAVRTAMGAGRERLVRQLLTESLILALWGGAAGVFVASAAVPLLAQLVPNSLPIAQVPAVDYRVLLFAALLTAVTGVGFGIVPVLRICGGASGGGLREGSRAGAGGRKERLRSALVIAEVTGCVVLLISSGLLIRALGRLQATDPGFRPDGVLTMRTWLPMPKYEKAAQRQRFYSRVVSEAQQLPGVTGAAYISFLPIVNKGGVWAVAIEGRPRDPAALTRASLRFVTPGFFAAMGIPIRLGRDVSESDLPESPFVAVVSESFVRKYWPGENPIGRRFDFAFQNRMVVGVVGDVRVRGLERDSEPQVYLPYRQHLDGQISLWYIPKDLVVRSSQAPGAVASALRRIIQSADREQPISNVRLLSEIVESETGPRRVQVRVLGAFAAVAFLLAAIGIHGLLSFAVSNRTQEIGVRIALGARSSDILTMVLRDGLLLAAIGVTLGVALAYAAGRTMESLLAGVKPGDAVTFASAVGLSLFMTVAGSLVPALRAVRVNPTTAIRAE